MSKKISCPMLPHGQLCINPTLEARHSTIPHIFTNAKLIKPFLSTTYSGPIYGGGGGATGGGYLHTMVITSSPSISRPA